MGDDVNYPTKDVYVPMYSIIEVGPDRCQLCKQLLHPEAVGQVFCRPCRLDLHNENFD